MFCCYKKTEPDINKLRWDMLNEIRGLFDYYSGD